MNYMKIDMNYIGFLLMNDNDSDFRDICCFTVDNTCYLPKKI